MTLLDFLQVGLGGSFAGMLVACRIARMASDGERGPLPCAIEAQPEVHIPRSPRVPRDMAALEAELAKLERLGL